MYLVNFLLDSFIFLLSAQIDNKFD